MSCAVWGASVEEVWKTLKECMLASESKACSVANACRTWLNKQYCFHNSDPCSFITFLPISVATHVTAQEAILQLCNDAWPFLLHCENAYPR